MIDPTQVDRGIRDRGRREAGRRRGRRRKRCRTRFTRESGVEEGIDRPHLIGVGGGGSDVGIAVAVTVCRQGDQRRVAAAPDLAPDLVAGFVVAVVRPGEAHRGVSDSGGCQVGRRQRRVGLSGRARLGGEAGIERVVHRPDAVGVAGILGEIAIGVAGCARSHHTHVHVAAASCLAIDLNAGGVRTDVSPGETDLRRGKSAGRETGRRLDIEAD